MEKIIAAILLAVGGLATLLFIGFLFSWPVMMLWNYCLVPAMPMLKEIGWLQGWGISILCGILFNKNK